MRRLLVCLLSVSLILGVPSSLWAAGPSSSSGSDEWKWFWERGEKKWLPQFELTARPGNHHFHGMEIDPIFPIGQSGHSMAFINPRGSTFWDHGDFLWELNVGGGYRHIMGDDSWILGGYGYYDRIETRWDNTFNQGTLGVEAMAWNWDARLNGYIADNDAKSAFGAGGSQVSLSGTNLSMQTMQEQALSGLDAEVGWRIPFFGNDGFFSDMRIYGGGFWFDDGSVVDGYGGPSARFEQRIWDVPFMPAESRVVLGANYTWDDVRQSRVQGIIALRVPLGRANRSQPLTHLERRMTDRVVRDVNVQTNTGLGGTEDVMTRTGVTIEDAIFFDEDGGGDGSFENPYDLPTAVGTGENNLLIGLARTGDIDVSFGEGDLLDGQTVLGGGMPLYVWGVDSGQDGVWVAPGEAATLCCTGTALTLADNNTVAGLFFRNMGRAIELNLDNQSTMVDIYNNHFSQMEHGVEIDVVNDSALTAWIWDNWFERQESGVDVWAPDTFDLTFMIEGNHFANLGRGLEFTLWPDGSAGASSFALTAWGNTFVDNDTGIQTEVFFSGSENYSHHSVIKENTFFHNDYDDYEVSFEGDDPSGELDASIHLKHNVSRDGDTFADIEVGEDGPDLPIRNGTLEVLAYHNEIIGTDEGIVVEMNDGPDLTAMITENKIVATDDDDSSGDAIQFNIDNSGSTDGHDITVADNWLENIDGDGVDFDIDNSYDINVTVTGNDMVDVDNEGIDVNLQNVGHDTGNSITISENHLRFLDDSDAIEIDVNNSYDTDIEVSWNVVDDVDDNDGISVDLVDTGHDSGNSVMIVGNTVLDTEEEGIDLELTDLDTASEVTEVTVADNLVRHTVNDGSNEAGVIVRFESTHDATVTIARNTIEESDGGADGDEGNGLWIDFTNNSDDNDVTVSENTISRSGEHAIELDLADDSDGNMVAINGNVLELADGNGIDAWIENGSGGNELSISGNDISYVTDGVQIDSFDATTMIDSDSDNIVTYELDDEADIDGVGTGEITVNGAPFGF